SEVPLMHFDLYRLDAPEDVLELGIEDAFADAICLIEWASRLGPLLPRQALWLSIEPESAEAGPDRRNVSMSGGARWRPVFAALREAFLAPS
ncbi:MAG: tRNA (adenosine(37)-N6)-threonylcarbamoyltransferase complex ATPase subunit type 1 TsaE, partial [Pseudomonadota bacterium]|nr:tRNA (adenosine(37)-N6)-threonylcarbamoyltransferase complex ATPase subunit type 1 TsaE [Pseudomonadota bacterium]